MVGQSLGSLVTTFEATRWRWVTPGAEGQERSCLIDSWAKGLQLNSHAGGRGREDVCDAADV